jgi:hypothetical protein
MAAIKAVGATTRAVEATVMVSKSEGGGVALAKTRVGVDLGLGQSQTGLDLNQTELGLDLGCKRAWPTSGVAGSTWGRWGSLESSLGHLGPASRVDAVDCRRARWAILRRDRPKMRKIHWL